MFNPSKMGKTKNNKIQLWRSELGNFQYEIINLGLKMHFQDYALFLPNLLIFMIFIVISQTTFDNSVVIGLRFKTCFTTTILNFDIFILI